MDTDALYQALRPFQNEHDRTFIMPLDQVDPSWTDVRALLRDTLAAQTLQITDIPSFPDGPSGATVTYRGTATLFPWPAGGEAPAQAGMSATAWFTVDGTGQPQLVLEAVPPAPGWSLADSLSGLAGSVPAAVGWETCAFLLSSTTTTSASYPGPVQPGINFAGVVATSGPFLATGVLLGAVESRSVAGPISLTGGELPVMTLSPALRVPTPIAGVQFEVGAEIASLYRTFQAPPGHPDEEVGPPWPVAGAAVLASVRVGADGAPVRLRMPLLASGDFLPLALDGPPVELASLDDLSALAGGANLDVVPSEVPPAAGFWLNGLSLPLSLGDGTTAPARGSITFDVSLRTGRWEVLPNQILTVDEVGVALRVDFMGVGAPSVVGTLYGRVTLVDVMPLLATIGIPGLDLGLRLEDGRTVSVADLMKQFMEKLTGRVYEPPVDGMELEQLDIGVSVRTGAFQLSAGIVTGWTVSLGSYNGGSLVTLGLESISLFVGYDGSYLSGTISAVTTINETGFYLTAGTSGGPDAGWDLGFGMRAGDRISVSDLLVSFMYPQGQAPGTSYGVPTLEITKLQMGMSTDAANAPYHLAIAGRVEGGWTFDVFGQADGRESDSLTFAAQFDLEGRRTLTDRYVAEDAEWRIAGSVEGSLSLFGLELSAGYQFDDENSALTFGIWYGMRGLEAAITRSTVQREGRPVQRTLLTVRLGDLSLGEILDFFVSLALPGEERRLPAPWDVLYQVDFRNLSLAVDLDTYDVSVDYALSLELGFASVRSIGITYTSEGGEGKVLLRLDGDFLGQPYGTEPGTEPLTWDVLNEPAPAVPGKGAELVDIRYVGMGQHVALPVPESQLRTVTDVLTAMKAAMGPVSGGGNPLDQPETAGLRYDANSKWLFGVDATLMETFTFAAVFYDPHLYGALVEVTGERGGVLKGLRFELVYRKVTEQIGQFSVDLRVPDAFRNWEFGAVSVTLGLLHVDVFTNGNFRIDAGFPTNGDFSRSFSVQVFPFIGQGGFYFAYLTGETSDRVPQVTNGSFAPVIEAGVGLALGVGKKIRKGPLSAGLTLEVYGIFEGIYAPFDPYDPAATPGAYYWFQGTAGVVGTLNGSVDFAVIKASLSIVARAQAVLTLQAHRASVVELHLEVTARASVKVLFVTLHFSFSLTLDASFTLGSDSPTPWVAGTPPAPPLRAPRAALRRSALPAAPRTLRQQRPQAPRGSLLALAAPPGRTRRTSLAERSEPAALHWEPVALYGEGQWKTARLQLVPALTVADPSTLSVGDGSAGNEVQVVLLLAAENRIHPHAQSAEEVQVLATGHLHQTDAEGVPAFPRMVETFLRWAALEGAGASGSDVLYAEQVQALVSLVADPAFTASTFSYDNLSQLLDASLHFEILNFPGEGEAPDATSGTFVAMLPDVAASVTVGGTTYVRNYTTQCPASDAYAANLAAYFAQLATDALAAAADDPLAPPLDRAAEGARSVGGEAGEADPSMAELVFGEYFALLTQASLQAAADLLAAFPVPYPGADGPTLAALAGAFPQATVRVPLARGQTVEGLAAEAGVHPQALSRAVARDAGDADVLDVPHGVTPLGIAQDNPAAGLAAFSFTAEGLAYQVRAGQTLDGVAAALPQQVGSAAGGVAGPLTGAAVGAWNASMVGLLREGAPVEIPCFDYAYLAGDTDAFLQAFFRVRNEGPDAVPNAGWFAQAISTLSPDGIDWQGGQTAIPVPIGYLDSTATEYTLRPGDTLERVAATLALWKKDPDGGAPVKGTYTVSAMTHTATSTDTFAGLVEAFPGLTLEALLDANTGEHVLAPLVAVPLPDFGIATVEGQTMDELAGALDLTLGELVALVEEVPGIFQAQRLTVRDVPGLPVDDLVDAVAAAEPANRVAAQVSRFLLHGLRVPSPQDEAFTSLTPAEVAAGAFTGSLFGAMDAAGLQFPWGDPAAGAVQVELQASTPWVSLLDAEVYDGGPVDPEVAALNPGLPEGGDPARAGAVIATAPAGSLAVKLTGDPPFDAWVPSPVLTLGATAAAMPLSRTTERHHELQATIHWQAAAQPVLDGAGTADAPGEPSLWLLPDSLLQLARAAGDTPTPAFALRARALDAPPAAEGADLEGWAWAVRVPFTVHRIPAPPPSGAAPDEAQPGGDWLPATYGVDGADQAGEDLLYALAAHLHAAGEAEAGTQLFLLYPPSAAGDAPAGLASDAVPAGAAFLLKTNLSTETRQPDSSLAVRSAPPAPSEDDEDDGPAPPRYSAGLDEPAAFTAFLWQATTVRGGGFSLQYAVDGAGLPDWIFDASGRATLTLLCLPGSQTGSTPQRGLRAIDNCAVVTQNVDASATQLYAVQTGGEPPSAAVATLPPGSVGFVLTRPSPEPEPGEAPTPEQLTSTLYNLFGWQVREGGGFTASNEGLPAGPADDPDDAAAWRYPQAFQASRLAGEAGRIAQHCAALPSPADDPYAGVSAGASVTVSFAAHDAFGNRAAATDPVPDLTLPFRYTDPLLGVGEWPGAAAWYTVDPGEGGAPPSLTLSLAVQAVNYLPAPGVETAVALRAASAHALRWARVFYQGARPGVTFSAATSLVPDSASAPLPLSGARLLAFAGGAYAFTSQVAALPPVWHETGTGETLTTVAEAFSVTPADLLASNADHDAGALFDGPLVVPRMDRVKQRETLDAFALRAGVAPATLLASYGNAAAPLTAGVTLVVADASIPVDPDATLAQMATAAGCAPGDVAAANADAAELLRDGIQLQVRGVWMGTYRSTFTSLVGDFAQAGITTTAAEIGAANAALAGIFVDRVQIRPEDEDGPQDEDAPQDDRAPQQEDEPQDAPSLSYVVNRWIVPAGTTVADAVAAKFTDLADFASKNGAVPGVLAQNTPLRTGTDARTAPEGVSLRAWAERTLGLTLEQLAQANATAPAGDDPAPPAFADGVRLMLPALLDPAPLCAVPYAIQQGQSLDSVAALFGTDAQSLGTSIQDVGAVFVPGQPVTVEGSGTVRTGPDDSLASLLAKFPPESAPTLDALVAAVAPSPTLLRAGAAIVCPAPVVPPGVATLSGLAAAFGVGDVALLGRCNAALDGFLDATKTVELGEASLPVGLHGTLASLFRRILPVGSDVTFDAFLLAVAGQAIVKEGAKVLLPPPPASVGTPLPAEPAVTETITELTATITVARPLDEVADGFGADSAVAARTSPLPALTSGTPAGWAEFAQGLQAAYGGRLRVGVGKAERATSGARKRLYVVRFEAPGAAAGAHAIRQVDVEVEVDDSPSFFAVPPLCRELLSRSAAIRVYRSGAEDPLPDATQEVTFRAIDAQSWAATALSAVDLVLSPALAAAAYAVTRGQDGTSPAFDRLVEAKKTLAGRIAAQLEAVVPAGASARVEAARKALEQTLDVGLVAGWETSAVIQLPTQVSASFAATGEDAGGHRFAGKPLPASLPLDTATTLGAAAQALGVDVRAVGRVLGGIPNLLQPDVVVAREDGSRSWTAGAHDTLQDGATALGMTLDDFSAAFAATAPLFRDGATVTANGYSATVGRGASLESMAWELATGVAFLAVANQSLPGLLTGTVVVAGRAYEVTDDTSSLQGMADAVGLPVDALAVAIAGQAVLAPGAELHVAALLPEYSLSAGKVGLDADAGPLTLLLRLADPASYRRVLLDLGFPLTGLEYGVRSAGLAPGYETSDWLQFVTPLTGEGSGQPAQIGTSIGQVDVPIPLRAYPTPPRLVGQYAEATYPGDRGDGPDAVARARAWTYRATFETMQAAQDLVWLTVGFNFAPRVGLSARDVVEDPFTALAELTTNHPAVQADLANLLLPPAVLEADAAKQAAARSAVEALSTMAATVARVWGPIDPDPPGHVDADPLVPETELVFTLETRTRPAPDGTPLIDALVLAREAGTAQWGPGGLEPKLGYVDEAGALRLLDPQPVQGEDDQLLYLVEDDVPAFERRVFAFSYAGLDAVDTQNARMSMQVSRNERLVPGQETNEAFVYRTPATRFAEPASPSLVRDAPVAIGEGPVSGLEAALAAVFAQVLGSPPDAARTRETLTVRYGYTLVPAGEGEDEGEGLAVLSPVLFRPLFAYDPAVPGQVAAAVQAWMDASQPSPDVTAFVSLEVTVFSALIPGRQQPLLDLPRLDYALRP